LDLDLSDDQELFRETTHRFLRACWPVSAVQELAGDVTSFDRALWERGAELGWTSMLVPEELGGGTISGEGVRDLGIVAEEAGRFLVAGPVIPTNIVAFALARGGCDQLAKGLLPQIAAGHQLAAWVSEAGAVGAAPANGGYRLTGVTAPVQDAHVADHVLVAATANGITQVLIPARAPGVSVELLDGLDLARRYCRVRLDGVEVPASAVVGAPSQARSELELQLALALALQCAETVGATEAVYELTLQYVRDRKAFGRPIGSYQALKHRLADMLLWLESSKAATSAAIGAVQAESGALEAARVAKAYVADRCPAIVRDCLQLHGGIGYTWEHELHLFLRRVEANTAIYGGVDHHLGALATVIGFCGGER
jgi:alkylation response protein AidB-like acyl-CoA dehydrogenase